MLAHRISTAAEARQHFFTVISSARELQLTEFEHGWTAREVLSPKELADGQQLGQSVWIIDRATGTVTLHPSLAPAYLAREYTQARGDGTYTGRQMWPWTAQEARSIVKAIRQESNRRTLEVVELIEDLWTVTPQPMPDEPTPPDLSYAADGQTLTIWEYPGTAATAYPQQKQAAQISGRKVYPVPT